jgi:hypothetical protein
MCYMRFTKLACTLFRQAKNSHEIIKLVYKLIPSHSILLKFWMVEVWK